MVLRLGEKHGVATNASFHFCRCCGCVRAARDINAPKAPSDCSRQSNPAVASQRASGGASPECGGDEAEKEFSDQEGKAAWPQAERAKGGFRAAKILHKYVNCYVARANLAEQLYDQKRKRAEREDRMYPDRETALFCKRGNFLSTRVTFCRGCWNAVLQENSDSFSGYCEECKEEHDILSPDLGGTRPSTRGACTCYECKSAPRPSLDHQPWASRDENEDGDPGRERLMEVERKKGGTALLDELDLQMVESFWEFCGESDAEEEEKERPPSPFIHPHIPSDCFRAQTVLPPLPPSSLTGEALSAAWPSLEVARQSDQRGKKSRFVGKSQKSDQISGPQEEASTRRQGRKNGRLIQRSYVSVSQIKSDLHPHLEADQILPLDLLKSSDQRRERNRGEENSEASFETLEKFSRRGEGKTDEKVEPLEDEFLLL
uniref:Uncharacterized protein n=1 Tax=Chromera velia CCMP2878 TaxID=1169474 RepID=A0A0G4GXI4_9ALVE|eukprot:Cvel_770.t1-p1 / transcript=Cvel_770.t1 / gene=Cvel_770 / organism=Chromera_velia_CCMP2878 / gene_product=hypothetical protein / transcript_product=hypothetical protein / location=Cvel_scaffold24:26749-28041(-) / protein_length=431 / sequence_SO=supercontig / SO=protein_coding / is_pseudo=false